MQIKRNGYEVTVINRALFVSCLDSHRFIFSSFVFFPSTLCALFVPPRRRHQLPVDQLTIQSTTVASHESVRDLGVYLDSDMSMHNVLAGLPQRELDRVQSVVNAAARLSADARKYDHVTPLLMDLHWLRVPECEVQDVHAHAPLPYWSGAAIFDRAGSACRQYCSSSSALGVIC